ncbi:MAG: hypothetical protein HRT71_04005 [Flavobacteriales bacterium]|nr:hypothetical protein [Flavobacteriales bacterium]
MKQLMLIFLFLPTLAIAQSDSVSYFSEPLDLGIDKIDNSKVIDSTRHVFEGIDGITYVRNKDSSYLKRVYYPNNKLKSETRVMSILYIDSAFTYPVVNKQVVSLITITQKHGFINEGEHREWFEDGSIKVEGKYVERWKVGLWKYWDEEGRLTQDIDNESYEEYNKDVRIRGGHKLYIDGVEVKFRDE